MREFGEVTLSRTRCSPLLCSQAQHDTRTQEVINSRDPNITYEEHNRQIDRPNGLLRATYEDGPGRSTGRGRRFPRKRLFYILLPMRLRFCDT